jgi:hypothetical protein
MIRDNQETANCTRSQRHLFLKYRFVYIPPRRATSESVQRGSIIYGEERLQTQGKLLVLHLRIQQIALLVMELYLLRV